MIFLDREVFGEDSPTAQNAGELHQAGFTYGAGCRCKHHWEWTCRSRGGAAVCLHTQVHGVPQHPHRHATQSRDYHVGRCRYMGDGQNQPCDLWAWCSAAPAWAGRFMHHPCLSGGGDVACLSRRDTAASVIPVLVESSKHCHVTHRRIERARSLSRPLPAVCALAEPLHPHSATMSLHHPHYRH